MSASEHATLRQVLRKPVFPSDFRRLFRALASVAVASSFGVATGCARVELSEAGLMLDSGVPFRASGMPHRVTGVWNYVACDEAFQLALIDEDTFSPPVASATLYQLKGGGTGPSGNPLSTWLYQRPLYGAACADATDSAACLAAIESNKPSDADACRVQAQCAPIVLLTRGDVVTRVADRAALVAALGGSIDSENEAALAGLLAGYDIRCDYAADTSTRGWQVRAIEGNGYELVENYSTDCLASNIRTIYEVTASGEVTYARSETEPPTCIAGRRPDGLVELAIDAEQDELGAYFARSAHLEAASVHAFVRVGNELRAFGAPQQLIDASWQAALDEIRHKRVMSGIARRFGGRVIAPRIEAPPARDAFAFALENAVEGCVRESYAALVACYQAQRALDDGVRSAMNAIADDETRHAQLAWQIAQWLEPQLDPAQRSALHAARTKAFADLRKELQHELPERMRMLAGLPDARTGVALLDQLGAVLAVQA